MPQAVSQFKQLGMFFFLIFLKISYANAGGLPSVLSQSKVLPIEQAFVFTLTHDDTNLNANWQIASQCYLYQERLQITLLTPEGEKISLINPDTLPAAQAIENEYFSKQHVYYGNLDLPLPLAEYLPSLSQAAVQVEYQGCTGSGFCYPPVTKWITLKIEQHKIQALEFLTEPPAFVEGSAPSQATPRKLTIPKVPDLAEVKHTHHIPTAMLTFYLLGILLAFTPCVLPMIPILFGVIVGQKHLNSRKAFWLSLCYVISMAITYAGAGILAALLGKNLQASLQHPIVITGFVLLLAYLALSQMGVVRVTLPHPFRLKEILERLHAKQESGTYLGAAIMGILATLVSSPCVTAPLIGALSYISQSGNVVLGGSALLSLGFGMGTVLLIAGTLGGKFLPRSGSWMHTVNHAFAAMMFGLCLWLLERIVHGPFLLALWGLWCVFVAWCMGTFHTRATWSGRLGMLPLVYGVFLFWGVWQGESDPLKPLSLNPWHNQQTIGPRSLPMQTISSIGELDAVTTQAHQQEQPMLLVFYADWCTACQHIEHKVLGDPEVKKALEGWRLVQADLTRYHRDNQLLLQKFALVGPPALLFFDKNGNELTQYRVAGEISKADFLTQLTLIKKTLNFG